MSEQVSFQLDLRVTNGLRVATAQEIGEPLDVREWTSWLRIRSDVSGFVPPAVTPDDDAATSFVPPIFEEDGLGVFVETRSHEDLAGDSIGSYYRRLETDELERLRMAVENLAWADLPPAVGGDYTAPQIEIRYASDTKVVQRTFNAACNDIFAAVRPVYDLLEAEIVRILEVPTATLVLSLRELDGEIVVTLRNRGQDTVVLSDPRLGEGRLALEYGLMTGDKRPHRFTAIEPLPDLPEDAPRVAMLAYRKRLELPVPWQPPGPGRYLVRAKWEDYRGPVDEARGVTPFMLLPEQGDAYVGAGPYPIRGALFAELIVEVPEEDGR